jgi:hypothetical protein
MKKISIFSVSLIFLMISGCSTTKFSNKENSLRRPAADADQNQADANSIDVAIKTIRNQPDQNLAANSNLKLSSLPLMTEAEELAKSAASKVTSVMSASNSANRYEILNSRADILANAEKDAVTAVAYAHLAATTNPTSEQLTYANAAQSKYQDLANAIDQQIRRDSGEMYRLDVQREASESKR